MRKRVAEVFGMVLRNWDTLIGFAVIYKTIGYAFLFPEIRVQLAILPRLLGLPHVGQQDIGALLRSPLALLLIAATLLLLAFYLLFEVVALLMYCEAGWERRRITLWDMWKEGGKRTAGLFRTKKVAVLSLALPLLLSVFSMASGWLQTVRVPEFVAEYLRSTPRLALSYAAIIIACNLLLFGFVFGMPAMLLHGASFPAAWRESLRLIRGRRVKTGGTMLLLGALLAATVLFAAAVAVILVAAGCRILFPPAQARVRFAFYMVILQRLNTVSMGAVVSVLLCAVIISLYHAYRAEKRPAKEKRPKKRAKKLIWRSLFAAAAVVMLLFMSETELGGAVFSAGEHETQIVAHRAGGLFAPENTVAALHNAIRDGADAAEIDVQQLRDGALIVLHDSDFRRTTGADLTVRAAAWPEVRPLDAGASFSPAYAGEPVPTLADMLRAAKDRIDLMIELKGPGGMERAVLDTIRRYGMESQCSIASMDLETLRRVKQLAPEIETVYISALLISDRYDLPYVDSYSVETSSLSLETVADAHAQHKKIYGWTANSIKTLNKLLRCQVDGLVTDNALLAAYCMETNGADLWMDDLTALFFGEPEQSGVN